MSSVSSVFIAQGYLRSNAQSRHPFHHLPCESWFVLWWWEIPIQRSTHFASSAPLLLEERSVRTSRGLPGYLRCGGNKILKTQVKLTDCKCSFTSILWLSCFQLAEGWLIDWFIVSHESANKQSQQWIKSLLQWTRLHPILASDISHFKFRFLSDICFSTLQMVLLESVANEMWYHTMQTWVRKCILLYLCKA